MKQFISIVLGLVAALSLSANTFTCGSWQLDVAATNGQVDLSRGGKTVLSKSCGVVRIGSVDYDLSAQSSCTIHDSSLNDDFGTGLQVAVVYDLTIDSHLTRITHTYKLYENLNFILTQIRIQSPVKIGSNYMAPIHSVTSYRPLPTGDNRSLFVPFDNDEWVRFNSYNFGNDVTSCEVGLLYNATTLDGLVVGSVQHTDWKSGVTTKTDSNGSLKQLTAFSGLSNQWTRDALAHGQVKGTVIYSAPVLVGLFDDWRQAMEVYGEANAVVAPKRAWNSGKPFVWNSWGVLQTKVNYMNAAQNAIFISDSLVTRGYQNDGTMYMDLDSYWDNLTSSQMKQYTRYCGDKGLKTGLYWTPFVDWANNANRSVEGSSYKYGDIWLYANGQPVKRTGACACDPTHPGTKQRAIQFFKNFHEWGYAFIKLDFMIHGIIEADKWYDPNITTGVQAYNYGMHYIDSLAADMYINLSIAPIFPANYANGRRIACDAYASIQDSEYTLESTTYGWWMDRIYSYNDGDNVVFKGQTISVNRVRLLSSLITGMPCIGDDYSNSGDDTAKERAKTLLNNPPLMQMARETRAFRPFGAASGTASANKFYTQVEDTVFVCLLNFTSQRPTMSFTREEVGLEVGVQYTVHELMRDKFYTMDSSLEVAMPRLDGYVFKIYPGDPSGVEGIKHAEGSMQNAKILKDGQIYILKNGKKFNTTGIEVQ